MGVSLTDALASPVAASVAQGAFSVGASRAQRKWSEKMYKKYNSPSALVRQYQEAGINPALMFGQSSLAAPTESSVAALPDNPVGDVVGLLGQLMQLDMLDEQKRGLGLENDTKEFNLSLNKRYAALEREYSINEILAAIDRMKNESATSKYEREVIGPLRESLLRAQSRGESAAAAISEWRANYMRKYDSDPDASIERQFLTSLLEFLNRPGRKSPGRSAKGGGSR